MSTRDLCCEVHTRIDEIPTEVWGRLRRPVGLYQSPEWLRFCELRSPGSSRYVVARDQRERVVAVVPIYLIHECEKAGAYDPRETLGETLADALGRGRIILVGSCGGYLAGWSLQDSGKRGSEILEATLHAVNGVALNEGAEVVSLQYMPRSEAELVLRTGLFEPHEFVLQTCDALIPIHGRDFGAYVAGLGSHRRSVLRRDYRAFDAAGFSIEELRVSEALDFAPRLLAKTEERHHVTSDEAVLRRSFEFQASCLDEYSVVFVARDPLRRPVAYSLSYVYANSLYVRLAGLDRDLAGKSGAYFHTTYYQPIKYACDRGLARVHVGVDSMRPKVLRGARLRELYAAFHGRGPALSVKVANRVSRLTATRLANELGALLSRPLVERVVTRNGARFGE